MCDVRALLWLVCMFVLASCMCARVHVCMIVISP